MTRFAGQALDITQFMPKDGPQYDKISDQVLASNSQRRTAGLNAESLLNTSGVNAAATAQMGNQKGQMLISQGKMNAAKTIAQAQSGAAATKAQGDAAQFGGMMSGLSGLATGGLGFAKNAGMFGGGLGHEQLTTADTGWSQAQVDHLNASPNNYAETVIDGGGIGPTILRSW